MEIVVKSKNCEVPPRVKAEAVERLEHAMRFFDRLQGVEALFAEEANPSIAAPASVEVTARAKGQSIRAEGTGADHRTALEAAVSRFERQLERHKTRLQDRRRRPVPMNGRAAAPMPVPPAADEQAPTGPRIVRSKHFELTPMLPEDAAWHLELLGHDFYVFQNAATGVCNVLYRRRDGDLGLIETSGSG
jgi:putative sigma-54 modulation protein